MVNLGRCRLLAAGSSGIEISTRAIELVRGSTVVDMLGLLTLDWRRLFDWQRDPLLFREADFRSLEASGINVFHPAVETAEADPVKAAHRWLDGWERLLEAQGCYLMGVRTISDLLLAPKQGKIGVLVGFQNSDHFDDAADVERFYALGQRVSQLTYNEHNRLGSGCYEQRDRGLSDLGGEIVAAMNHVGMAIDVSHCGERTSAEAIAHSRKPVLITHANCSELNPGQPRCKSDRILRLMRASGGVMGITMVRAFVGRGSPSLLDLMAHFEHAFKVAGIEHVGIGSDVDVEALDPSTGRALPMYSIRGLSPRLRVFQIADELLRRGHITSDVENVLGGNFLRALARIWPDGSWEVVAPAETRRDPFCPAPRASNPSG
jgi:membrane dipeptidase